MVKHTQIIRPDGLFECDHFVGLALKELSRQCKSDQQKYLSCICRNNSEKPEIFRSFIYDLKRFTGDYR